MSDTAALEPVSDDLAISGEIPGFVHQAENPVVMDDSPALVAVDPAVVKQAGLHGGRPDKR